MSAVDLGPLDLTIAAVLVLIAGVISLVMRLDLERQLAVASARTVVQLLLIGHLLRFVFGLDHPGPVLLVLGLMVVAAARAAVGRAQRGFEGLTWLVLLTLAVTGFSITATVTQVVIRVEPWYRPQYVLPLLGMLLGNTLTALSLAIDHFLEQLDVRRDEVEADLALGATRWEAARRPMRAALRRALIPIVNAMSVVGIVSLPGMMTGQILAGADPVAAVEYQILIMFMLAGSCALSSIGALFLVYRRLFDEAHRLRAERITPR